MENLSGEFSAMAASFRFHMILLLAGRKRFMSKKAFTPRTPRVVTKLVAYGGIILVEILYASYSPIAKPSLDHLDPMIFNSLVMLSLVPVALFLLVRWRGELSHAVFVRGALFGICLGTAFLLVTLALKDTSITQTTVFSCVNGVIATLIAWLILRQRVQMATWGACLFSVAGAALVWLAMPADWQGNFTAFMAGSLLITYAFLVERLLAEDLRTNIQKLWPVLGVQLLTMVGVALAFALCSGDWQTLTMFSPSDAMAIGYAGVAATLLPLIISPLALRHVNVITVSFFTVIGPLTGAISGFALGERFPGVGYIGFGVVLVGVVLQALVGAHNPVPSETHESAVALSRLGWESPTAASWRLHDHDKPDHSSTPLALALPSSKATFGRGLITYHCGYQRDYAYLRHDSVYDPSGTARHRGRKKTYPSRTKGGNRACSG